MAGASAAAARWVGAGAWRVYHVAVAEPTWNMPFDTSVAHPARRYDYWLGGKDNFAADRASGDAIEAVLPTVRLAVRENRAFLRRAVTLLADTGVSQFLDIGTGIPTADNTHQVAQARSPKARVVYVDNDPIVLAHARALLTSTPEGATAYIDADLRDPDRIINDPDLARTLDLTQPVGLMLVAILHFILDSEDPAGILRRLASAMPSGSYVVITHATADFMSPDQREELARANAQSRTPSALRSHEELAHLLDGLELLPPGIVPLAEWRAEHEPQPRPPAEHIAALAAVARIP